LKTVPNDFIGFGGRLRFIEDTPFGVKDVARFLGVSDRRVRALLAQGRIHAFKRKGGMWEVVWPLRVSPGRRGPDLKGYPVRRLLTVKPSKASGKGKGSPPPSKIESAAL
jgi:hypothetical protein